MTNIPVAPLADVDRDAVDNSLKAIKHIFAFVHHEHFNTTFFYNMGGYPGGANSLLYYLEAGWSSLHKRIERTRNGTATEEDYEARRAP